MKITVRIYSKLTGCGVFINSSYPLPECDRLVILGLMVVYDGIQILNGHDNVQTINGVI
jgi:hypothetical protein